MQGFIEEKIGSENGPFTKINDLKTDPSQKNGFLKGFTKIRDIKTDPKIENYNVIFYACSAANEFTRKLLKKKLTKLHFFLQKIKIFSRK